MPAGTNKSLDDGFGGPGLEPGTCGLTERRSHQHIFHLFPLVSSIRLGQFFVTSRIWLPPATFAAPANRRCVPPRNSAHNRSRGHFAIEQDDCRERRIRDIAVGERLQGSPGNDAPNAFAQPDGGLRPGAAGCGPPNQSQKSIEGTVGVVATSGRSFSDWMPKMNGAARAGARQARVPRPLTLAKHSPASVVPRRP